MEIEIKAKVNNLAKLRKQVLNLGAKKIKNKHQVDLYLSPPHKSFFNTCYYLRVRQDLINKTASFDYHILKSSGQYSVSKETEVEVKNGKVLLKILKELDFTEICVIDKKREVFQYQDFEIVLDKVKNLGNFIEVELKGSFRNREKHKNRIIEILDKLGVKSNQYCKNGGYVELWAEKYSAKNGNILASKRTRINSR